MTQANLKQSKTLQLIYPQWQGGANPNYQIGAQVLASLLPLPHNGESVTVPIMNEAQTANSYKKQLSKDLYGQDVLLSQQQAARAILEVKQPHKIITIGGDCSISQIPFDYLHGQYPENTAILWLDAHPDIMTPKEFDHEHAMVLGNLLGYGASSFANTVAHPFKPQQILYVGLIEKGLWDFEKEFLQTHNISYLTPQQLTTSKPLLQWLSANNIEQLIVHLDLDVLNPRDFRSLLCNKPHQGPVDYAVGEMNLAQVVQLLLDASTIANLVGLSIAEYLPWDIINLRNELSKLSIFRGEKK